MNVVQRDPALHDRLAALAREVRIATAGVWARRAIAGWARRCAAPSDVLIGEAPLVGGRLAELVRPRDDEAELLLATAPAPRSVA